MGKDQEAHMLNSSLAIFLAQACGRGFSLLSSSDLPKWTRVDRVLGCESVTAVLGNQRCARWSLRLCARVPTRDDCKQNRRTPAHPPSFLFFFLTARSNLRCCALFPNSIPSRLISNGALAVTRTLQSISHSRFQSVSKIPSSPASIMGADFVLFLFILVAMYSLWLSGIFELCAFLMGLTPVSAPADAHTSPSDDKPLDKPAELKHTDQVNIIKNADVKPIDPKLADRKAYVLKALNLKPSDIKTSVLKPSDIESPVVKFSDIKLPVVKTSDPKPSVVKTSDSIKSKEIARADTKVCDPIKL